MLESKVRKMGIVDTMTPQQYLRDFLGINIRDDIKLSENEFHFLAGNDLRHASNSKVNIADISTGKIILIRFSKGIIKPYYRPNFDTKFVRSNQIDIIEPKIKMRNLSSLLKTIVQSGEDEEEFNSMLPRVKCRIIDKRRY